MLNSIALFVLPYRAYSGFGFSKKPETWTKASKKGRQTPRVEVRPPGHYPQEQCQSYGS